MRDYLKPMENFPWQRVAYGRAIEQLMAAGAKSVTLDLIFDLPSSYGAKDDQQFAAVLKKYSSQVVLGAAYDESPAPEGLTITLSKPNSTLLNTGVGLGFVNYPPLEVDGRIHQLASNYRQQIIHPLRLPELPTLAEATLEAAQRLYPHPQSSRVRSTINYYGSARTFTTLPFSVLAPNKWNAYKDQFRGKIVLIGTTAESLKDLFPTPFGTTMPGVEIHANSIATLLQGKAINEGIPGSLRQGLFVFFLVGATGVLLVKATKRTSDRLFWSLGLSSFWVIASYGLFTYQYLILPTAIPVLGMLLSGFSYFTTGVIQDQIEKRRFRNTLERYVAAPVVREILKAPEDYNALLKGRKIKAAILFSDIRGFTTLSSHLEPEPLVEQLNVYLDGMVEAILEAGGTVDKFIGDAVMAEFGSPFSQGAKNDALNALRAALGMRAALADLRQHWLKNGQEPLFNGIGINYGELIAGDIGSKRRREYAVIGDAVNVASRVESLTKQYKTDLLITQSLYDLITEEIDVVFVGEQEVKGRSGMVKLYSVLGFKGKDHSLYHQVHEDLKAHLGST
jgi:adenylate cyclase